MRTTAVALLASLSACAIPNAQARVGVGNAAIVAGIAMTAMTTTALVYTATELPEGASIPVAPFLASYGLSALFALVGVSIAQVSVTSELEQEGYEEAARAREARWQREESEVGLVPTSTSGVK